MRSQSHWSGGPPPPPPPVAAKHKHAPIPSWGIDLRQKFIGAAVCAVLTTGLMLLAGTGMLRTRPGGDIFIDPDGVWAGILVVGAPLMWAYGVVKFGRNDNGFRSRGLPSLMLIVTVLAAVLQIVLMLLWPLVVDKNAHGHTVLAQYNAEPLAFGLTAVFVLALYSWTTVATLGFVGKRLQTSLFGTLGWIVIAGVGAWQGMTIFENPATAGSFWVWAGIALLGLALIPVLAAVRSSKLVA